MEKMEFDPKIKEDINKEGFDDDGGAVLIGKKEEMPQLLERLEKEGRAEDVGSYTKMHKQIVLPKERVTPEIKERIKPGMVFMSGDSFFLYVDKDGNIARVDINPDRIASLKAIDSSDYNAQGRQIEKELTELGFEFRDLNQNYNFATLKYIEREISSNKINTEDRLRQKRRTEFDF